MADDAQCSDNSEMIDMLAILGIAASLLWLIDGLRLTRSKDFEQRHDSP